MRWWSTGEGLVMRRARSAGTQNIYFLHLNLSWRDELLTYYDLLRVAFYG